MGIEPMTNGLLDQRSTDWAMRPTQIRQKNKNKKLQGRESNPGFLRDRQEY